MARLHYPVIPAALVPDAYPSLDRIARLACPVLVVHGEHDAVVSRVHAERAARTLAALHVPVTLDIVQDLGHALTHSAICLGSLRLLQGIYEGRRATLH